MADALEIPPELLPYIPELLADLEELGTPAADVIKILRVASLAPGSRVLDLGCGKGAALLALAQERGFDCVGVDAMASFVEHARQRAQQLGVAHLCRFEHADLRDFAVRQSGFDLTMLLAIGAAIGPPAEIVNLLRGCTRPGGYMLIDDSYLLEGAGHIPEYAGYSEHASTVAALTSRGDRLLAEQVMDPEFAAESIRSETELIRKRAQNLAKQFPHMARLFEAYVERQEREMHLALGPVRSALWLLQKTP